MQTNSSPVPVASQSQITPEIHAALKTSRHIEFRLEAEFFHMDWQSRLELADELRQLTDDLTDELTDVAVRAAEDLESEAEDFSTWETRSDAARRIRQIVRALAAPTLPCNCNGTTCESETFPCATCGRQTPNCRGAADNRPDDCDECWQAAEKGGVN